MKKLLGEIYTKALKAQELIILILGISALLGVQNLVPDSFWSHPFFAWYWPSRTVTVFLLLLTFVAVITLLHIRKLSNLLDEKGQKLTPEALADKRKEELRNFARFTSRFLGK